MPPGTGASTLPILCVSCKHDGNRVRKALGGAGTVHQLRHSFACANYARNGHDIVAVQALLGHSSVATTQNYVGVTSDVLRASVDAASIAHGLPAQRQGCAGPTVNLIEGE